jgi:hypothetical protein
MSLLVAFEDIERKKDEIKICTRDITISHIGKYLYFMGSRVSNITTLDNHNSWGSQHKEQTILPPQLNVLLF